MRHWWWRCQRVVVDAARRVLSRRWSRQPPGSGSPAPATGAIGAFRELLATHRLIQPDRTSCGSSVLVALNLLHDRSALRAVAASADPVAEFGRRALAMRRVTNAAVDARHAMQLPWPAVLGTRPAALIRMLRAGTGGRFRNAVVDPADVATAYDQVVELLASGRPLALYVGNGHWMQHIVLALAVAEDSIEIYEPARGELIVRSREQFVDERAAVAGWDRLWLVILPR